ncbi:MAG: hypothetical protein SPJ13_04940 [Bacteroidales bacterium]|nr:hypothetical protein [Bacteroidales bacterium]
MKRTIGIMLLFCSVTMAGCKYKTDTNGSTKADNAVEWMRFEEVMFDTQPEHLQSKLTQAAPLFGSSLLNIHPDNPEYMSQIIGMAQDPTCRELYDTVQKHYADLSWLNKKMDKAMARSLKLDESMKCPKAITFISGSLDYTNRVAADHSSLLIAIDQYVVPYFKKYGYFQLPTYLVALSTKEHILPDAMAALARAHIVIADGEMTLLDYMVADGKVQYYLHRTLPKTNDTLLFRYNAAQMSWAKAHTRDVWAFWIQHDLLFEKDYNEIFNFIEDAPKTNAFGDSAPRMTEYIGWQIVEAYMAKNKCTLHQLFQNSDARQILNDSGWKPNRK